MDPLGCATAWVRVPVAARADADKDGDHGGLGAAGGRVTVRSSAAGETSHRSCEHAGLSSIITAATLALPSSVALGRAGLIQGGPLEWLRRNAFLLVASGVLVGAVILAVRLLRPVLSISPGDKTAVPVLAAAVTVTGVFTTAAVTLTGIILKQSIDLRTTRLAERAAETARVDQQRLLMETALQTVQLLGSNGEDSAAVRGSAALVVLSRLGELGLALDLAAALWPRKKISSSSAIQLVQAGLTSGDHDTQYSAAMLLRNNTGLLYVGDTQYEWPRSLDSWPEHLPSDVRHVLARALKDWFGVRPAGAADWRRELLRAALARESDPDVKHTLAAIR